MFSSAGDAPPVQWAVYRRPIRCQDGTLRRWERLAPGDSSILEKSFLSEDINEVEIEFGRYTASASGRWMQAYYWRENKWPLVRGTWFWRDPVDGSICPFGEADAATIEEAFRDISSGAEEGPIDCELVDTDIVSGTVQFVKEKISSPVTSSSTLSPSPTIEKVSTRVTHCLYRQTPGFSRSDRVETFRGYPVEWVGRAEESLENNNCVAHLVLVVHGIGEALHNRQNDPFMGSLRFRGHCDLFRDNLNNRLLESSGENKMVINGRIEVLPVEWAECIHNNTLDRRMESVTIPNLQGVRDFANLALSDVFLYTQSEVKDKISKFIKMRIEYILKRFLTRNPLQQQQTIVSFVGHSLGSVVLYDMFNGHLARKSGNEEEDPPMNQFLISPAALFFLGSPLALFQTIRDPSVSESPRHVMDLPCRVFNIFHPYDAIAYRVEPLIDTRMKDVEPILVPHRGGHRVHVAIKKSITEIRSAIASFSEWVYSNTAVTPAALSQPVSIGQGPENQLSRVTSPASNVAEKEEVRFVKMMNYNERIDYVLQESAVESVSEWVAAVGSHFTYWRHEDVYTFIVSKLIYITKNRSNLDFI